MKSKVDFPLSLRWGFKDAKSWQTPIQLSPNLLKGLARRSLVGAQLFSTKKTQHQNLLSKERQMGDYLDVSIRGMAHDFANFSNYHQFEQLIMDRHLSKNYLIQLAAGRPHLDKGRWI